MDQQKNVTQHSTRTYNADECKRSVDTHNYRGTKIAYIYNILNN